jgi:hypothetical protein
MKNNCVLIESGSECNPTAHRESLTRFEQDNMFNSSYERPSVITNPTLNEVFSRSRGVYILVDDLTYDAQKLGITKDSAQVLVERSLSKHNVTSLSAQQRLDTLGRPLLHVNIGVKERCVVVQVSYRENIRLERTASVAVLGAILWHKIGYGSVNSKADVYDMITSLTSIFASEFSRAN